MRQFTERYSQADYDPVTVDDDGELQDHVFCLHCHTVNSRDAELCGSCQQPIVELPTDLRDRLERIRQHVSECEAEGFLDIAYRHIDNRADSILNFAGAVISTRLGSINRLFAPLFRRGVLVGNLSHASRWTVHVLGWPFRRVSRFLLWPAEDTAAPSSPPHRPLKHAVAILHRVGIDRNYVSPGERRKDKDERLEYDAAIQNRRDTSLIRLIDDLFQWPVIALIWFFAIIFTIGAIVWLIAFRIL